MPLTVSLVSEEKELRDIYRLRYKVYCLEWGFEKPENHPDEIVKDVFDEHALHFAAKNDYQKIVGAISLILDSPEGFPTEKYCEININSDEMPKEGLAEISRLVVHRDYRKRSEDKYVYGPDEERRSIGSFDFPVHYTNNKKFFRRAEDRYRHKGARRSGDSYIERRKRHEVVIGLLRAVYQESKRRKLTHWYTVMTQGVVILLSNFGFKFQAIGDPVDFHGIRTPYLGEIAVIEEEISAKNPELFEELTENI